MEQSWSDQPLHSSLLWTSRICVGTSSRPDMAVHLISLVFRLHPRLIPANWSTPNDLKMRYDRLNAGDNSNPAGVKIECVKPKFGAG